jgi:hypothetical protein
MIKVPCTRRLLAPTFLIRSSRLGFQDSKTWKATVSTFYFHPMFVHLSCYPLIATLTLLRQSFGRLSKASGLCDRSQDSLGPVIKVLISLLTVC